jgi:hypothetical protein
VTSSARIKLHSLTNDYLMHNLIFYALFMVYFLCLNTVLMLSVVSIAFVSSYLYFSYLVSFSESTYKTFLAAFEHLIGLN